MCSYVPDEVLRQCSAANPADIYRRSGNFRVKNISCVKFSLR